jgi:hypothetical protein
MNPNVERAALLTAGAVAGALVATKLVGVEGAADRADVHNERTATPQHTHHPLRTSPDLEAREAASASAELQECGRLRDFYKAQLVVYEGTPQAWPASSAAAFGEAALTPALRDSIAPVATLESLHCEEYPCVAIIRLNNYDNSCCTQVTDRLPDAIRDRKGAMSFLQGDDGRMTAVMAFGDPRAWASDIDRRSNWRVDQLFQELKQ